MRSVILGTLALSLAACNGSGLRDHTHQTGSSSLVRAPSADRVVVVNSDAGSVSLVDTAAGTVTDQAVLGGEPVRVARAGERIYVTVRGTGQVAVLRVEGGELVETGRIEVGPDPFGLVASEDGGLVYVAIGLADEVVEIDTATDTITRRFSVPGQPRWLALHPSGKTLYAGSAFGGTWSSIDLVDEQVSTHTPPGRTRFVFTQESDAEVALTPRITGDPSVSPYGDFVAFPVFYVDNTTPVESDDGGPAPNGGYASGPGVGRTNPTVLIVETEGDGDPKLQRQRTVFAQGFLGRGDTSFDEMDGEFDDELGFGNNLRSYVSSLTVDPSGLSVLATMEGSAAVLAIPVERGESKGRAEVMMDMEPGFGGEGFEFVDAVTIRSDAGPRGAVFLDRGQAFVDTWLDRSAGSVPFAHAQDLLRRHVLKGEFIQDRNLSVGAAVVTSDPVLSPEVEEGRRLFFSATDSAMAAHSGGISCATCHFDGRNDGLTWTFAAGERQTPSLAGVVSETTPVTWTSEVPTVATEVRLTSRDRMGGSGASVSQSYDVEAFIDTTPYPQVRRLDLDRAAVDRGRDLFFGEAGCADCHHGAAYTDRTAHDMFGLEQVMTPTLRGIAATAPYGHDGRDATLRDVVENAENNGMGRTNHLTDAQKDDLALFLSTL